MKKGRISRHMLICLPLVANTAKIPPYLKLDRSPDLTNNDMAIIGYVDILKLCPQKGCR